MAQQVEYWQDNIEYLEGPFVVVNAGGYRIEMELKGHCCPVQTTVLIDRYLAEHKFSCYKTNCLQTASDTVDWLNNKVKNGDIILVNGRWVPKKYTNKER
jgi:hypothetical protein